jgi:tRNA-2-methylthio-N6-dimethylallyladenosine synthase
VGNLKKLYRENKDLVVGVCGCMAQEEGFVTRLLEKYPWVHLIFGTHNLQDLPEMLEKAMQGEKVVEVFSREGEVYENLPVHRYQKHKAWVNIMYGCDKFCTYCIVPYTRGKQRSRTMDAVLQEVKTLKKLGYREITLLGQNVNAYGKDLDEGVTFASLLEECAKTGIDRIRFMTSHPWDFSDEMIDIIAKYDNIMPAIHLPLQSGDSQILRRMGRRYTAEQYYELYSKIRERVPGVSITTDIIVGFPEESDEAFENTLEMVRKCAFDNAFTFIYSPRPGTPAAQMEDSIPMEVKKERLLRLNELWNALAAKRSKTKQDTTVKVLVDGFSKKNKEVYAGYTEDNKTVNFTSPVALEPGMIVPVHITDAKTFSLDGQLDLQCYNDKQEDFV